MHYLYGSKPGVPRKLVATFGSEQQLRAYASWATLSEHDGVAKFEAGSALAGYQSLTSSKNPSRPTTQPKSCTTPRRACCSLSSAQNSSPPTCPAHGFVDFGLHAAE